MALFDKPPVKVSGEGGDYSSTHPNVMMMAASSPGRRPSMPICRVCRSGATETSPLFYPCQCSGSIKYVHQECLVQWLKLSKKTYCELCHHKFSFTPIYKQGAPDKLPLGEVVKAILSKVSQGTLALMQSLFKFIKVLLLISLWFGVMPLLTGYLGEYYLISPYSLDIFGDALKDHETPYRIARFFMRSMICYFTGLLLLLASGFVGVGIQNLRGHVLHYVQLQTNVAPKKKLSSQKKPRETIVQSGVATLDSSGDQPPLDSLTDNIPMTPSLMTDGIRPAIISRRRVESGTPTNNNFTTKNSNKDKNSNTNSPSRTAADNRSDAGSAGGRWINQVTNKEYRGFLKRRELVRQRERLQLENQLSTEYDLEHYPNRDNGNINNIVEDVTDSMLWEDEPTADDEGSVLSAGSWLSRNSQRKRSNNTNINDINSYRCKVCNGKYCLDRDHVVLASQPKGAPQLDSQDTIVAEGSTIIASTTISEIEPEEDLWPRETLMEDIDLLGLITLDLKKSLSVNLKSWTRTIVTNITILHCLLFFPLVLGHLVLSGTILKYLHVAVNFVFASAIENVGRWLQAYLDVRFIVENFAVILHYVQSFQDNPLLSMIVGYGIVCALASYIERVSRISKVRQWSFLVTLSIRMISLLAIEYLLPPVIMGLVFLGNMTFIAPQIGTLMSIYPNVTALVGYLVGRVIWELWDRFLEVLRQPYRPGLFFLFVAPTTSNVIGENNRSIIIPPRIRHVDDALNLEHHHMQVGVLMDVNKLVSTAQKIVQESVASNLQRAFLSLAVILIPVELIGGTVCWVLSKSSEVDLDKWLELAGGDGFKLIQWISGCMLNMLMFHRALTSGFFEILQDMLRTALSMLSLKSFCHGGRFMQEERRGQARGRWHFLPDSDDREYSWRRVFRLYSQVMVQPVDIAKLPVKDDNPYSSQLQPGGAFNDPNSPVSIATTTNKASVSRYRGYNVVFCPSHLWLRLLSMVILIVTYIIGWMLSATWAPLYFGRKACIALPFVARVMNGDNPIRGTFDVGAMVVFIMKMAIYCAIKALYMRLYPESPQSSQHVSPPAAIPRDPLMKRIRNVMRLSFSAMLTWTLGLVLVPMTLGMWLFLLMSPWLYPSYTIPLMSPLMSWPVGMGALLIMFWMLPSGASSVNDRNVNEIVKWIIWDWTPVHILKRGVNPSLLHVINLKDFVVKGFMPIQLRLLLWMVVPPLGVLLTAPLFNGSRGNGGAIIGGNAMWTMSQLIQYQKQSFSLFFGVALLLNIISKAVRWHQTSFLPRLRDERYLERIKLNNLSFSQKEHQPQHHQQFERTFNKNDILATSVLAGN